VKIIFSHSKFTLTKNKETARYIIFIYRYLVASIEGIIVGIVDLKKKLMIL
jgi:hypothetical protein